MDTASTVLRKLRSLRNHRKCPVESEEATGLLKTYDVRRHLSTLFLPLGVDGPGHMARAQAEVVNPGVMISAWTCC